MHAEIMTFMAISFGKMFTHKQVCAKKEKPILNIKKGITNGLLYYTLNNEVLNAED